MYQTTPDELLRWITTFQAIQTALLLAIFALQVIRNMTR